MNKKTITICSSSDHYKDVLEIESKLKALGFKTKIPKTARVMKRTNNFNVASYKTWYKDKKDYGKKTKFILAHFKKIVDSDAILIVNMKKNGIEGYIGGNTLMEIALAFHLKKPIFIYNNISDALSIKEEIYGVKPKFINRDLEKINVKS
jgi:hypothetical protein